MMMNTNVKRKEVQLCKIKSRHLLITMDKRDCDKNTIIIDTSYQIDSSKSNKKIDKSSGVVLLFIGVLGSNSQSDCEWSKIHSSDLKRCKPNILGNPKMIILDHQVVTILSEIKHFMVE